MITVYAAKKVITMDLNMPEATHVAVRGGPALAAGGPGCANGWGEEARIDDRFADRVYAGPDRSPCPCHGWRRFPLPPCRTLTESQCRRWSLVRSEVPGCHGREISGGGRGDARQCTGRGLGI